MKYEKLYNLRIEKNLTTKDMAKMMGVTQPYYWQLENKKRRLYYSNAVAIAKIFNLKPDDIFYNE